MRQFLLVMVLCLPLVAFAGPEKTAPNPKDASPKTIEPGMSEEEVNKLFKYQTGKVTLRNGLATLNLPEGYRYLDPDQSDRVLVDLWGNPPGPKTLGMIFPPNIQPTTEGSWVVVIRYEEEGFVKDDEADSINYSDLLKEMQESAKETNEERKKKGYDTVEIVGWAEQPSYDKAAHKLYWAKNLKFSDSAENTLNYDVRVLGRRGVLSLNAVSTMAKLTTVKADMKDVIGFVEFNEGNRYTDFNPNIDKVAAYGIGALIVGTVAAKAGLFKGLFALLLAGKKFVAIAVVALFGLIAKLFSRKSKTEEA